MVGGSVAGWSTSVTNPLPTDSEFLVQSVDFHERDTGSLVRAADDGSVRRGDQRCDNRRFRIVGRLKHRGHVFCEGDFAAELIKASGKLQPDPLR